MRRTKEKGCTTVIILFQMTHIRKSIGILLINSLAYYEAQLQTFYLGWLQITRITTKRDLKRPECRTISTDLDSEVAILYGALLHPVHNGQVKSDQNWLLLLDLSPPAHPVKGDFPFFQGSPYSHPLHPSPFTLPCTFGHKTQGRGIPTLPQVRWQHYRYRDEQDSLRPGGF